MYTLDMPIYLCEICKTQINDIKTGTHQYVKAWLRVGTNTEPTKIEPLYIYAHSICIKMPSVANTDQELPF